MVEKEQAILEGFRYELHHVDHIQLNKFNGSSDARYTSILAQVHHMYYRSQKLVRRRLQGKCQLDNVRGKQLRASQK